MTDKDEEILVNLLLQWEEQREKGQEALPDDLCHNHPHLVSELTRRIQILTVTSWLDQPISTSDDHSSSSSSLSPESRSLIGRYRLDYPIAEGGFAHVWRGYDLELQRVVAVKIPKPSRVHSAEAFMAEARRVARLKHPGVVPVFDVGTDGDVCFIVSEFVEGGSLGDHLVKNPPIQQQAIRWVIDIADTLEYAHLHGIIHRDIKPANILIDHHGRALLADFGIAQSAKMEVKQTLSLGTLQYMSPEQLEGRELDPRADIFSLGVVLHEILTGRLPYSSIEPNDLRREIVAGVPNVSVLGLSEEIKQICQKALERDPQRRYTSAAHFAADLRSYLASSRSSAPVGSSSRRIMLAFVGILLSLGLWTSVKLLAPSHRRAISEASDSGQPVENTESKSHWLNTLSGVRHNQRCEHFQKTKLGRFCGPHEGTACRICGG